MEKPKRMKAPLAVCPSCGLQSPDSPHPTSSNCIRALEAERRRLSELLERAKPAPRGKKPR
jgi:hypothetical protein